MKNRLFKRISLINSVNSEWYTTICLSVVFQRNQENPTPKTDHSSPRQCELSHIFSKNCIFEHSKNIDLRSHPPYRPDLEPNDFFLFPYVKNEMRGQRFSTPKEEVNAFRMHVLEDISIRVTKVLRQLVQTYAKVYGS